MNISKKQIDRIESSCDEIKTEISKIQVTLAVNTSSLAEHMRRTDVAEKTLHHVIYQQLPPIKATVDKIKFLVKLVPWVLGAAAAISAIVYKTGISLF